MSELPLILSPDDAPDLFARGGGGKAENLAKLVRGGLRVPPFICLSTAAFQLFLDEARLDAAALAAGGEDVVEQAFLAAPLPQAVRRALLDALAAPALDRDLAVRSSAAGEDSATSSFAGQLSSFLHVRGAEGVARAVRRCWASAFSARAMAYRKERGITLEDTRVAVVVQAMVAADVAGVAFSRDPTRPLERDSIVVSSVWGLGEGLVSGELDADHFEVTRSTGAVAHARLVEKTEAFARAPGGGVTKIPVPLARRAAPSLDDRQVLEVADAARHLEEMLGAPQDIEWAYEAGALYLLQARPVTNLPPDGYFEPRLGGDAPILWDNSNIIESYCGVTTPLTFSSVNRAYTRVYEQFAEVMGVPAKVVAANADLFRNMLGLVRGRVFYNLVNWYRLLHLFPNAGDASRGMETMMGVKQGLSPEIAARFRARLVAPKYSPLRRASVLAMTLYRLFGGDRVVRDFVATFEGLYARGRAEDLEAASVPRLIHDTMELQHALVAKWQAPIVNDMRCMVFFAMLKQLVAKWLGGGAEEQLSNDLLCGQGDVESTEPTKALLRMGRQVASWKSPAREEFLAKTPEELRDAYRAGALPTELATAFAAFLDRYGFRCVNELKLEEKDLHEEPSFALAAIQSYVRGGQATAEGMESKEREIRERAEAAVDARISGLKRGYFRWVLGLARKAVRTRESLRFMRTKGFGLVRQRYRAIGRKLHAMSLLEAPDDVFYLTMEELEAFAEGRAVSLKLGELATLRRLEWDEFRRTPAPPDRFLTTALAGLAMRFPGVLAGGDLLRDLAASDDPDVLRGTPCSPGVVEGAVRVVHGMDDARGLAGEILVTERTDPGWVPLYPSCSGLLVERGSLLSHSAVVARELGLPTIVGISGGMMRRLRTGDRVRMDGGTGEIRILKPS